MHTDNYQFYPLDWDTQYFGIPCAKAILDKPMTSSDWEQLNDECKKYTLAVIENRDCSDDNAQYIGKHTTAFLADVNVAMEKELRKKEYSLPTQIEILSGVEYDEQILAVARHTYTRMITDPELAKRGGKDVLKQILINAFGNKDMFFALSKNSENICDGYFLFYYQDSYLQMRQASVLQSGKGIGMRLFHALEYAASERGVSMIKTGLSLYNKPSMNIHIKNGFKLTGIHQIYHLWNLAEDVLSEKEREQNCHFAKSPFNKK